MKILSLCLLLIATTASASDGTWDCGEVRWLEGPMLRGKIFVGTQETTCTLSKDGATLARLDQMLLEGIKKSDTVHSGPTPETYEGVPGVAYDVTVSYQDGASVTLRQNVHIAQDASRVLYATQSKSIAASGMAAYLRKIDLRIEVVQDATPGKFTLTFRNTIHVQRPWYAPSGIFLSKAASTAAQQFRKSRDQVVPEMLGNL